MGHRGVRGMAKFSNQVARWSVFFILFLTGILCGCSFFDLHDLQSDGENLINGPENGSANVAFNIVIPGRQPEPGYQGC